MSRRVLYLQGPSILLNPTLDQGLIDAAYTEDREVADAEWGGKFRSGIVAYLDDAVIERALCPEERSRSRLLKYEYVAFVDPAGGVAGGDEMTCAIAHSELGARVVLDQLSTITPPFDTEQAVASCALVLKSFGITSAKADRYAGLWPAQSFSRHGITLHPSDLDKSAIYRECAPLFVSGLVSLLDDPRLEVQLRSLERTPRSGGKPDAIDHPPGRGAHDDRINAVCGALLAASKRPWLGLAANGFAQQGQHISGTAYDPFDPESNPLQRRSREPIVIRDGWGRRYEG